MQLIFQNTRQFIRLILHALCNYFQGNFNDASLKERNTHKRNKIAYSINNGTRSFSVILQYITDMSGSILRITTPQRPKNQQIDDCVLTFTD